MEACCQGNHREYRSGTHFQVGKEEVESTANGQCINQSCLSNKASIKKQKAWGFWELTCRGTRMLPCATSVQFSCSVVSDSLRPHWPKHTRLPCPSPTSGAYSTLVHRVSDAILLILCHPLLLLPSIFPSIRVFSNESALRIRWPKYCSFSFSIRSVSNILTRNFLSENSNYNFLLSWKIFFKRK